jgi:hypothetical protein
MLGSTVLELALGLCVFYIALSLVCSGVTQYVSEWRERRGRILVEILSELVNHAAHDGESILSALLADARIAGGPPGTKPTEKAAPDQKALVLPAGGRIDESVFTDVLLDLVAGKMIRTNEAAAASPVAGVDTTDTRSDPTGQLVERLLAAVRSLQTGLTVSLSGPDLAKWDTLLKEIQPQIDALKGLPLDDVSRRAEAILKAIQVAATAEGQAEIRARLLDVVAQETDAVLGLARRLTTAKALALVARDMPESPLRSFLSRLASRGALEPDEVKVAIQDWYSRVNDRVSVEYRSKTKLYLFLTGLGVTLLLNADTLQIANRLVKDEALRKFVAQDAVAMATISNNAAAAGKTAATPPPAGVPPTPNPAVATSPAEGVAADALERLNIPLRWTPEDWEVLTGVVHVAEPRKFFGGLYKILGLAITALALTMGAEFWYNLLKQLVPALPGQKVKSSSD